MSQKKNLKEKRLTNPNKVNQFTGPDPRQAIFLVYWLDPTSETFGNIFQSGVKAGFSETYATNLKNQMPEWLSRKLEEMDFEGMLSKVRRNLNKFLDIKTEVQAMGAFGPLYEKKIKLVRVKQKNGKTRIKKQVTKIPIIIQSGKFLEIQQKTTHFVAETVGKKDFSKQLGTIAPSFNFTQINNDREKYK